VSTEEPKTYSAPNSLIDLVVPLVRVRPSEFNPRKHFDEAALLELSASIREHGLLEPIVVRVIEGGNVLEGPYQIVAGERRYRACVMAGLGQVAVRIHPSLDDATALRLAIIENVQRVDLDPIEEATGYRALAELGMKQREIAESVKRSQPAVANAMRLLDLPADVQERIQKGELSASHGIILASYKDLPSIQSRLAEVAATNKWSTKELEKPWSYSLPDRLKNVTRELNYNTRFDVGPCESACPQNAYRHGQHGGDYCLKPSCYDQKQAAVEAERQAKIRELVEKAKSDGGKVLELRDIPYGDRSEFRYGKHPFPKCLAGCPSFAVAMEGKEAVQICTKPSCFNKLDKAAKREKDASRRQTGQDLLDQVTAKVDRLSGMGCRETALIALTAFGHLDAPSVKAALKRHCPELEKVDPTNWGWRRDHFKTIETEAVLPMLKAVVESALRYELRQRYELGYGGDGTPFTDWYLEGAEAAEAVSAADETPSAEVEICKIAGLPCDPATCVQRCPKAAAAQAVKPSTNGHCAGLVSRAIRYRKGASTGTLFACDAHADLILSDACRLGEIDGYECLAPTAAGKLACNYRPPVAIHTSGGEESA
jgi:ParB/RepB/Spo0J family partition protein